MSAFTKALRRVLPGLLGGLMLINGLTHAGTVTYVYTDPQGTPLAEADASGNITATFDYAPYGGQALGTAPDGPGYTGHVNDPESGLVYMQARYYDPAVGRFVSADPVVPSVGDVFNFNRFAYANNNPVVNMDADGRMVWTDSHPAPANCETNSSCRYALSTTSEKSGGSPTKATLLAAVVVTAQASAVEAGSTLGSRALFLGGLGTLGVSLFVMDANGFNSLIHGRQGCYGSITCEGRSLQQFNLQYQKTKDVPDRGPPGEWVEGKRRSRLYNPDGSPKVDIDKPHAGAPNTHVHDWVDGVREHPGRDIPVDSENSDSPHNEE